jgi:hypothetical protein
MQTLVAILPYATPGFLGLVLGWYGHMKFGKQAQAAANTVASAVEQVKKDV